MMHLGEVIFVCYLACLLNFLKFLKNLWVYSFHQLGKFSDIISYIVFVSHPSF